MLNGLDYCFKEFRTSFHRFVMVNTEEKLSEIGSYCLDFDVQIDGEAFGAIYLFTKICLDYIM